MRMSDGSSDVCSSDLLLGSAPPQDLAAFRQWWLSEPGLDTIGPRGRIAPQGEAGAGLMVLVMDPEAGDSQSLLSGAQGRLIDAMLRAMGMARAEVYLEIGRAQV